MRCAARFGLFSGLSLLTGVAVSAQTSAAQFSATPPSCSVTVMPSHESFLSGPGAPYSAVQEFSRTYFLADGTVISQKLGTGKIYRDSLGRLRTEDAFCNEGGDGQVGTWVEIQDPFGGYVYILDTATHTAYRYAMEVLRRGNLHAFSAEVGTTALTGVPPHSNTDVESLGLQTMEGLAVEGVRYTTAAPFGQIGDDRPPKIVHEAWASPLLRVVILNKVNDPRTGEFLSRLTHIDLSEPDPTLFQPPSDYAVVDETEPVALTFQLANPPRK